MEVDYMSLGKRIRFYRERKGMTQQELAESAELDRSYIGHIERGDKNAGLETIISIANALQVSSDSLLIDSLFHSDSNNNSEADYILLDCSEAEEKILTKNMKALRETIRPYGIK